MESGEGSVAGFENRLSRLVEHTEASSAQKAELGTRSCYRHQENDQGHLHDVMAGIRLRIINHRRILTTTCRVVESDVCNMIANHALVAVGMKALFDKLCDFFRMVQGAYSYLVPQEIDFERLKDLSRSGNPRQHFHAIREFSPPFRVILRHLSYLDQDREISPLQRLGRMGIVAPNEVNHLVATAAFGDTDEILSPPEHLRSVWKPVAKERIAPEDRGEVGTFTQSLWRTHLRVKNCDTPPMTDFEVQSLFGIDATLASHAQERLPYDCGRNKYTLNDQDPFVLECTAKGLFTSSGPSGTAYRYLNMWLALGGSRDKLPELRFATAAMLLGGSHHSLIEALAVCAPLCGCRMPQDLKDMLDQLVPRELELTHGGVRYRLSPEAFYRELNRRLDARLA